jgi:hypothetical protein
MGTPNLRSTESIIRRGYIPTAALLAALLLPGCATIDNAFTSAQPAAQKTYAGATVALTAADNVEVQCYTPPTSPCAVKFAAQKAAVKIAAQKAHDALKAAEPVTAAPNALAAAWASITAYESITDTFK